MPAVDHGGAQLNISPGMTVHEANRTLCEGIRPERVHTSLRGKGIPRLAPAPESGYGTARIEMIGI